MPTATGDAVSVVEATQHYETTVHDRRSGRAFTILSIPARALTPDFANLIYDRDESVDALPPMVGVFQALGLGLGPIDLAAFHADIEGGVAAALLGEPLIQEEGTAASPRKWHACRPFTQFLTVEPLVPVEESPVSGKSLAVLSAAPSALWALEGFESHILLVLLVPAGIVICGAAKGVARALEIGLRVKVLEVMGVDDPDHPAGGKKPKKRKKKKG